MTRDPEPGTGTLPGRSKRDIALVTAARFLSLGGAQAAFVVGIWGKAAFELEASAGGIAFLMAGIGVAWFVGSAIAGTLVDRFGPRRVFVIAGLAVAPASLAVIAANSLWQLVALAALVDLVNAHAYNAAISTPPFLAEGDAALRRVNVILETAARLSLIAGAGAGALIARLAGIDWVFLLHAGAAVSSALLFGSARFAIPSPSRDERTRLTDGVRFVYGNRSVRYFVWIPALLWMSFSAFEALEPLFFRDVLGTEPDALGWVNMVFGIGLTIGSLAVIKFPGGLVSATGLAAVVSVSGVASLLFVGAPGLSIVAAGAAVWGFVFGLQAPVLRTLIHTATPRRLLGRVSSTAEIHDGTASLLPLAFVPALAAAFGVRAVLVVNAILLALVVGMTVPHARALDRRAGAPAGPPDPGAFPHRVQPGA
jgi:predicted MFS family arabinose efflux permease